VARLGGTPDVLRLPVAHVVHQDRLCAGFAAQKIIVTDLDPEHAPVIRQPIREKGLLAHGGAVVAPQGAEEVSGQRFVRVEADGLDLDVHPGAVGRGFLEPRDLQRVNIGEHRVGQGKACLVVPFKIRAVKCQLASDARADLRHDVAGDRIARVAFHAGHFGAADAELFSFRACELSSEGLFARLHAARPGLAERGHIPEVERVNGPAQLVQIKADVVNRLVLRQHPPAGIENFSAHRGDANGSERLRFEMRLVIAVGNNLHPPQARQQDPHAREHHQRQRPERRVIFL